MNAFNALWNNPEQTSRPPDDNFQLFTTEEWLSMSSTHKILSGSFRCPLPSFIEPTNRTQQPGISKSTNQSTGNSLLQRPPNHSKQKNIQQSVINKSEEWVYIPGLCKAPDVNCMSSLTADEQKECLRLLIKFDGKSIEDLTPSEKAEHQLFHCLYTRVKQEQTEFLKHAKANWLEFAHRAAKIKRDPNNYLLQHWNDRVTRVMALYSKNYKKLSMISYNHQFCFVKMHLIKNVLNIGKVPVIKLPNFKTTYKVSSYLHKLKSWGLLNIPPSQLSGTLHRIPVSRDPNAERLARHHGADVVISTSAFKCLVDNHDQRKHPHPSGSGQSWMIPVTVREHRTFSDGKPTTRTIVYVDKVLPRPKLTTYEEVCWYQKQALFSAVVHRFCPEGIEFDIKGVDFRIKKNISDPNFQNQKSEDLSSNSDQSKKSSDVSQNSHDSGSAVISENLTEPLSVIEKVSSPPTFPVLHSADHDSTDEGDEESSDEFSLKIALPEEETEVLSDQKPLSLKITAGNKNIGAHENGGGSGILNQASEQVEDCINKQTPSPNAVTAGTPSSHKPLTTTDKWKKIPAHAPVATIAGHALPVSITNVTYNLWSFQSATGKNEVECKQPKNGNINLLIRSRIDGCEIKDLGGYQPLCLASKPEFQLEYGAGAVSLNDLSRQWAKLLIQPDSLLARVRVNVQTSELVKVEKRTCADLENEAQGLYGVDLNGTLAPLFGLLSDLKKLSCGEYLLSHTPAMGLAAELLLKVPEGEASDFCLSTHYGSVPVEMDCEVPWQPLDPATILPKNLHQRSMPCTFPTQQGSRLCPKRFKKPEPKFLAINSNLKKKKNKKKSKRKHVPPTRVTQGNE